MKTRLPNGIMNYYNFSHFLIRNGVKLILSSIYLIRVEGISKCPANGPFLVVINHVHRLDMLIVIATLPISTRPIIAYDIITGHALLSSVVRGLSTVLRSIVIDRNGYFKLSSAKQIIKALNDSQILGIAPEGTRTRTGDLQKGRHGAAYFA